MVNLSQNSSPWSFIFSCDNMGPESIPESNWIIVTPVYLSPARIVDDTGEAPLYLGKSEGWRLIPVSYTHLRAHET